LTKRGFVLGATSGERLPEMKEDSDSGLRYQDIIRNISAQTNTAFSGASPDDLAALRALQVPEPVVDFYAHYEPKGLAEGQVRLWPIADIVEENRDYVPGAYIAPLGYIVFSTTFCGDTYCFDLNQINSNGEPRIVLVSHEAVEEDISAKEAFRLAKPVAKDLHDFLDKFSRRQLDEECIY
jgi:hypothetical protein